MTLEHLGSCRYWILEVTATYTHFKTSEQIMHLQQSVRTYNSTGLYTLERRRRSAGLAVGSNNSSPVRTAPRHHSQDGSCL
jgi:hypothetical protein